VSNLCRDCERQADPMDGYGMFQVFNDLHWLYMRRLVLSSTFETH
jgi:hypothetical protein